MGYYFRINAVLFTGDAQSPVLLMEQIAILRETMLKQCDEIRMLHHELDEKSCEVEAVSDMEMVCCHACLCLLTLAKLAM
jgi:hypothetical protein